MKRVIVIAGTLVLVAASGCSSGGVGTEGDVVGGSCADDGQCADGSRCLVESDFPGGTCTVNCESQDDCPDGSTCTQMLPPGQSSCEAQFTVQVPPGKSLSTRQRDPSAH